MKLSALRTKTTEDVAETEQEMAAVVMNAAKKTLISQAILHSLSYCVSAKHAAAGLAVMPMCFRQFDCD